MTRRATFTRAELVLAAQIARDGGVAVTIAAGGKTVTIAPVDGKAAQVQPKADPFDLVDFS